jgi:hypothetical protein
MMPRLATITDISALGTLTAIPFGTNMIPKEIFLA